MHHEIEVLLETAKPRDSSVDSIIESVRLRAGYTQSHAISSIEARERAISSFPSGLGFCTVAITGMHLPSLRVQWRGNLG